MSDSDAEHRAAGATTDSFETAMGRYIIQLRGLHDPAAIWAATEQAALWFGPGSTCFAVMADQMRTMLAYRSNYPPRLFEEYAARGLSTRDAILQRLTADPTPFALRIGTGQVYGDDPEARAATEALLTEFDFNILLAAPLAGPLYATVLMLYLNRSPALERDGETTTLRRMEIFAAIFRAHYDYTIDPMAQPAAPVARRWGLVTEREAEALRLSAAGNQTARIAEAMGISEPGAKKHLANARRKLGARTREEAVARASYLGVVPSANVKVSGWRPVQKPDPDEN